MTWLTITDNGRLIRLAVARDQRGVWIGWPGGSAYFEKESRLAEGSHKHRDVRAPMTGKVIKLLVKQSDTVAEGDVLVILEAMKMEYRLAAPHAGTVEEVHCQEGELVDLGKVLIKLVE
jgi:3-methylcrotonyl-CoA carboxylase alpha subunit